MQNITVGSFLPKRQVKNDNPYTNGEYLLYRALISSGFLKRHTFCVGAAGDFDMIKYFPDNGSLLHLFEPRRGSNYSAINALKHYAKTSNVLGYGERCQYLGKIMESHINGDGGIRKIWHEPISENVQKNIRYNNYALGARPGLINFWEQVMSLQPLNKNPISPSYQVEVKTLKDYCAENSIEHIDFLKIDTEGWELEVMKGGEDIILHECDFIQFEYGGTFKHKGITLKDIYDFLKGWSIYNIEHNCLNFHPYPIDDFQYTNYFASPKPLV